MQEVIDPHVERYEDLKKILASIQETNQKNEVCTASASACALYNMHCLAS